MAHGSAINVKVSIHLLFSVTKARIQVAQSIKKHHGREDQLLVGYMGVCGSKAKTEGVIKQRQKS